MLLEEVVLDREESELRLSVEGMDGSLLDVGPKLALRDTLVGIDGT